MRLSGIYWRRMTGYSHFRVGFVPPAGRAAVCMHVVQLCVHAGGGRPGALGLRFRGTAHPAGLLYSSFRLLPSFLLLPLFLSLNTFMFQAMERMILPEEQECVCVCVLLHVVSPPLLSASWAKIASCEPDLQILLNLTTPRGPGCMWRRVVNAGPWLCAW